MMIARASSLLLVGLLMAGCAHKGPASIAGGECKIFDRPPYEVRGQKQFDQDWIDSSIEGGVGGCGWDRPAARPPELDAAPNRTAVAVPAPAKKKPGLIRRIKSRAEATFTRKRAVVPVLSVPTEEFVPPPAPPPLPIVTAPPEPAPPPPPPPPPPPRRSLVDQLLHPE